MQGRGHYACQVAEVDDDIEHVEHAVLAPASGRGGLDYPRPVQGLVDHSVAGP